jgi:hypothetical protein
LLDTKYRNLALIFFLTITTIGSSIGILNYVLSVQNKPNDNTIDLNKIYDFYGGVGLFDRGIHVIATKNNPLSFKDDFSFINSYWQLLKENKTTIASSEDFISIIISRGNFPTGGYTIQVKSFSWLESYPVKLRFQVNFTDPGENVIVTQASTNPLVLIPLGKLDSGEYTIEVNIISYILTFDQQGNPVYTQLQTFKAEIWTETFVIQ